MPMSVAMTAHACVRCAPFCLLGPLSAFGDRHVELISASIDYILDLGSGSQPYSPTCSAARCSLHLRLRKRREQKHQKLGCYHRQNVKDPRILIILVWVLTTRAETLTSPGT